MSTPFVPFLGDGKKFLDDMKAGRPKHYHQIEYAIDKESTHDLRLLAAANFNSIYMSSPQAHQEFIKLVPKCIERKSMADRSFGSICPESLIMIESSQNWRKRREAFMKHMGLNNASQYLPIMIEA